MKRFAAALLSAVSVLVGVWGIGTAQAADPSTAMVAVSPQVGTMLVDGEGRSLYMFVPDDLGRSVCFDRCAQAWPPLLVTGAPVAGPGVNQRLLGTSTRPEGTTQVTYAGWPLYRFVRDQKPGDVLGQGSGGAWFVVSPHGSPRQTQAIISLTQQPGFGGVLSDNSGRTHYLATNDERNKSNCQGAGLEPWPPVLTIATPLAGPGVNQSLLGTIRREEGSSQVTYNGWPLYYFRLDIKAGDVAGQGRQNPCGTWYVMSAAGQSITAAAPAAPAALPRTGDGGLASEDAGTGAPVAASAAAVAAGVLLALRLRRRSAA